MAETTVQQLVAMQLLQVTILVSTAGLVASFVMKHRPHLAHAVLLFLLAKCLLPPIIPGGWLPWPQFSRGLDLPQRMAAAVKDTLPTSKVSILATFDNASKAQEGRMKPVSAVKKTPRVSWPFVLLATWLFGFLVTFGLTLQQWYVAVRRWQRSGGKPHPELQRRCTQLAGRMGIRRPVRLVVSSQEYGPLISGWRRPIVVLPACFVHEASMPDIELAMAHELAHLRRGDTLTSGAQCVARSVWWFHPLVWWLNTLLDRACEQCCDDEVIDSLACEPARYARCLLGIIQKKHRLRPVRLLPGTRPFDITAARLARLGQSDRAFFRRAPWCYWLLLVGLAVTLLPARPLTSSEEGDGPPFIPNNAALRADESATALRAFQAGHWEAAIQGYETIVRQDPADAAAWYRLGYALHATGKLAAAIEAHQVAATFPQTRRSALYNLACAYAVTGRSDEAMDEFERAITAGFRADEATICQDEDWAGLADHPRFADLVRQAGRPPVTDPHRELEFVVGQWRVTDGAGKRLGQSVISKDERGFLLTEKWEATDGSTGTSITYYDPKAQAWRQTFVGMFGNVMQMQGDFVEGALTMRGESVFSNGVTALCRSTTRPRANGDFVFQLDESRDGGETWRQVFDGLYRPL